MIALSEPHISAEDKEAVLACLDSGWISTRGDRQNKLAEKLCSLTELPYGLCLNSGTTTLTIALMCLKLKPNSLIALPDRTYIATASAIILAGHRPIFYGTQLDDLSPELNSVEAVIKKGAKAIIAVHIFGLPFQEKPLSDLCDKNHVPLIFDSAEALGSKFDDKAAGSSGRMSLLSFNANKIITSAGGGFLACSRSEDAFCIKKLADHGTNPNTKELDYFGGNFLMTDLLASLALSQLNTLNSKLSLKKSIYNNYINELAALGLLPVPMNEQSHANHWLGLVQHERSLYIIEKLQQEGIQCRPFFPKISNYKYYSQYNSEYANNAPELNNIFALPSSSNLKESDQNKVIHSIKKALK